MAKVITEANDKVDTPVAGLLAELAPLSAMKGVPPFKATAKGNGVYDIWMNPPVKDGYTEEDGPIYRGGGEISMSDADIRNSVDKKGFMKRKGVSLNLDKDDKWVQLKGGAFEVDISSIPDELEIIRTSGTHYEIVPKIAGVMPVQKYQELISKIVLKPFNTIR
ncbi:MAG: hypothetical protein ACK5Z2_14525 [Bacteroidota bacterium]|jgi:hypothetical protein